jgi:hypothetical protein
MKQAASLFFNPEDGGDMFLLKCRLTFTGLDSIVSHKTVFFIATALDTSKSTFSFVSDIHLLEEFWHLHSLQFYTFFFNLDKLIFLSHHEVMYTNTVNSASVIAMYGTGVLTS